MEMEFEAWRIYSKKNYAAEQMKQGVSAEAANADAEKSFVTKLPQGKDTPGQFIYAVVHINDGNVVGYLWWGPNPKQTDILPWIYDIEIKKEYRGKGYGRATMELALADVKAKGFDKLGLHVFGHNKVAHGLYESLGFETTNIVMQKKL